MALIIGIIFYSMPVVAVCLFVVSLVLFCVAKHDNKRRPGSVSAETMSARKTFLIVSSVIAGAMMLVVGVIVYLAYSIVVYM